MIPLELLCMHHVKFEHNNLSQNSCNLKQVGENCEQNIISVYYIIYIILQHFSYIFLLDLSIFSSFLCLFISVSRLVYINCYTINKASFNMHQFWTDTDDLQIPRSVVSLRLVLMVRSHWHQCIRLSVNQIFSPGHMSTIANLKFSHGWEWSN